MNESGEEQLAALLGQATAMAEALRSSYQPPPEIVDASDTAGVVTVTLEGRGKNVTRVLVAADWKEKTDPEGLELAVLEAVLSAQLGPLRDFLSAVTAVPSAPPAKLTPPRLVKDPTATLDWDDLGRMFETVDRALDAFVVHQPDGQAAAPPDDEPAGVEGVSDNRRVTVSFVAGQLTSVKIDSKWALSTNRQALCDSLRQAFSAAYSVDSIQAGTAIPDTGISSALRTIVEQMGVTPQTQLREEPEA